MSGLITPTAPPLSATYAAARETFLQAATSAKASMGAVHHPMSGPHGEDLAIDTAWIGHESPQSLLIMASGTHGVEGAGGSMAQSCLLPRLAPALPDNMAALFIHAVNPWGFAYDRRVNENNVDMNRNFVADHTAQPRNAGYETLHAAICPPVWTDESRSLARAAMRDFQNAHGPAALQAALSAGQYKFADGVFYGGEAPQWSNLSMMTILANLPDSVEQIIFIDLHTGLGPFGVGELIIEIPESDPIAQRAHSIFGAGVASTVSGESVSAQLSGPMDFAAVDKLAPRQTLFTALEFGTVPQNKVFAALQADNWLHAHGSMDDPQAEGIKNAIRAAFRPNSAEWNQMVLSRVFEVTNKAILGLQTKWVD